MLITENSKCRMCNGKEFETVIDMGENPLVNSLLTQEEFGIEETTSLMVKQCQKCFLVQIKDIVDATQIYQDVDYLFFSSDMPNLDFYFRMFAEDVKKRFLKPMDFIIEIGSNDGIWLKYFREYPVLGIDPATNVVLRALNRGVPTIPLFFSERLAKQIKKEWGQAKVIMGANCIAHLNDLRGLMKGVNTLLAEDGVFIVECNYWGDMVKNKNYALIYHDHFSYFTLTNWVKFARKFGMRVFDAIVPPAQGISELDFDAKKEVETFNIRLFIDRKQRPLTERIKNILEEEEQNNLHSLETVRKYEKEVKEEAAKLNNLVNDLKSKGAIIAGYGAAAKGFSVLKLAEIDEKHLDYFIDDSPAKQGKYTPVSHIPIISRKESKNPDYFLITAPNYQDTIIGKEREFLQSGGKFITIKSEIIDGKHSMVFQRSG